MLVITHMGRVQVASFVHILVPCAVVYAQKMENMERTILYHILYSPTKAHFIHPPPFLG